MYLRMNVSLIFGECYVATYIAKQCNYNNMASKVPRTMHARSSDHQFVGGMWGGLLGHGGCNGLWSLLTS